MGLGESVTPAWGIYDVGINWYNNGGVPVGQGVQLVFSLQENDNIGIPGVPPTQWNSDSYPFNPGPAQEGFYETLRIYPTTASIPELSAILLLGGGVAGVGLLRRKLRK